MKCDELKRLNGFGNFDKFDGYYDADEADAAIAELKDKNVQLLSENMELNAENERLKAQMPRYKQFEEREKFLKTLVDEYDGYVYDWEGKAFIATPYINIFIKGILRALWLARAERAKDKQRYENVCRMDGWVHRQNKWVEVERLCWKKAEEYGRG